MLQKDRPTIWIVEDDPEICCLFSDLLITHDKFYIVCVEDAGRVLAKKGDLIFLDLHGTRARNLPPSDAQIITMSGDSTREPDLEKPFHLSAVRDILDRRRP